MGYPKCPHCDEHMYSFPDYDEYYGWNDDYVCENNSCPLNRRLKEQEEQQTLPIQDEGEFYNEKIDFILKTWNYHSAQELLQHVRDGKLEGADKDAIDLKEWLERRETFLNSESL